ncbi:MAG: uncharacterized protein A8A55_3199, partial [Amphiamblys sp. WSBS2006]
AALSKEEEKASERQTTNERPRRNAVRLTDEDLLVSEEEDKEDEEPKEGKENGQALETEKTQPEQPTHSGTSKIGIVHQIETGDADPIAIPPRKLSLVEQEEVREQLGKLQEDGVIQESKSPWAAPVVFAKKKNGELRMCVDYRELNRVTRKCRVPIPRIDETLDRLGSAKIFTALDLKSGYHQIPMAEEDIPKTAFSTRYGLFEYKKMPFGLCNAPATFTRAMNQVLRPLLDKSVVVYLDDILVYSKDRETHREDVKQVLRRLEEHGLKINEKKCVWNKEKVNFLGYVIENGSIGVDPNKADAVEKLKEPENVSEVRCLLGMCNFYRNFIPEYAKVCAPLFGLLKKEKEFSWGKEQHDAVKKLKEELKSDRVLHIPTEEGNFVMRTDASEKAVGGVLLQENDGILRTIAFESRKTLEAERRYPVHELELLGIIYC